MQMFLDVHMPAAESVSSDDDGRGVVGWQTPSNAFDDFDTVAEDLGGSGLAVSKKPSPQRVSEEPKSKQKPAARGRVPLARESGVVAKARQSAIVDDQSSQALWQQALDAVQREAASSKPAAAKPVKRRRI